MVSHTLHGQDLGQLKSPLAVRGFSKLGGSLLSLWCPSLEKSVWKMISFGGNESNVMEIPYSQLEVYIKGFSAVLKERKIGALSYEEMTSLRHLCNYTRNNENGIDTCAISLDLHSATIFSASDGYFYTNYHALRPALQFFALVKNMPEKKAVFKKTLKLPVYIFNSNKKLIYNFIDSPVEIILPYSFDEMFIGKTFESERFDRDYVKIKMQNPILFSDQSIAIENKTSIPFIGKKNARMSTFGDQVYLLGYPACTNCFREGLDFKDRGGNRNSDGESLYFSQGELLDFKKTINFLGKSDYSSFETYFETDRMLFAATDSLYGMSGGPFVNNQCQVVGIFTGGTSKEKFLAGHERLSRGIDLRK